AADQEGFALDPEARALSAGAADRGTSVPASADGVSSLREAAADRGRCPRCRGLRRLPVAGGSRALPCAESAALPFPDASPSGSAPSDAHRMMSPYPSCCGPSDVAASIRDRRHLWLEPVHRRSVLTHELCTVRGRKTRRERA